ncbi:MAG: UDP-N-acetylglucosamine--N-acetylmuramyl-(pentapeptide) pyrophosphoryl-undecaprenol N-acetylglucosamine transferase [Butyricicoccus sp.]|nr:UDP-N-acetylglucosamine--N-acetylmuramyl-(pentapeptide) pyrophosphoryl-undecaprenol N-acetylglucosamine transferase [Butyricicoccus sp.]
MNFLFTCGGTAGHINPALGIAGRLRELMPDCGILFVGARGMMETELVPREGYDIETVTITNLQRSFKPKAVIHNIKTVKNVFASTTQARKIIGSFRPDVAVGTGGYVCYPVLRAAHSMGVPTLVHESNAVPGLTTKMLAGVVDCVMTGFDGAGENYKPGTKAVFTGTPVRTQFGEMDKAEARRRLGLERGRPLVLSVWGSLGADRMNDVMTELIELAAGRADFSLMHSAGKHGYSKMKKRLDAECPGWEKHGMDVREYIYDMPTVMAAADLIICRSGASTLGELTALGKPAILVPSPNVTGNHQEKNARVLEKCGAAEVLLEGEFTPQSLYGELCRLLGDEAALERMSKSMSAAGERGATEKIASLILDYVKQP